VAVFLSEWEVYGVTMKKTVIAWCLLGLLFVAACAKSSAAPLENRSNSTPATTVQGPTATPTQSTVNTPPPTPTPEPPQNGTMDVSRIPTWPRYKLLQKESPDDQYAYYANNEKIPIICQETPDAQWVEIAAVAPNEIWSRKEYSTGYFLVAGVWNGRLYLSDGINFSYINLSDPGATIHRWVNVTVDENILDSDNGFHDQPIVFDVTLVDDTLYYSYNSSSGGLSIYALSLTANSMDESVEIIDDADFGWVIDQANGLLYYSTQTEFLQYSLWTYDLVTGQKAFVVDNASSYVIYSDGMILHGPWSTTKDVYLYDTNTQEDTLVVQGVYCNSGGLWSTVCYHEGAVYWQQDNQILKQQDDSFEVVYTVDLASLGIVADTHVYFYGFELYDEDTICLVIQSRPNIWLVHGQVQQEPPESLYQVISVEMLDGGSITASEKDFVLLLCYSG